MIHKVFLCFVLVTCVAFAKNLNKDESREDPLDNPDLFEGDIIGFNPDVYRSAIVDEDRLWPNGRIPYTIDSKYESQEVALIQRAMKHYVEYTCIRFVPRTDEKDYLRIFPGGSCYSRVGMAGDEQPLSLGHSCFVLGTVVHELGHAVGFFHEHSRSDRDDYVDIHWENIREGAERQFKKLEPDENQLLTPFDFDSIMLYAETVFARAKRLKTITAKDGRKIKKVNNKPGLSISDIKRINLLYDCK